MTDEIETPAAEATPAPPAAKPEAKDKVDWRSEFRGLAWMLLLVALFQSMVAKQFYIPSISMMPGLLVGDHLVVSKYPYGWNWSSTIFHLAPRGTWRVMGSTPEYGDIVIVVPRNRKEDLIKRVIGLPGDRIALVHGQVILNGKPVPKLMEPPMQLAADRSQLCDESFGQQWCNGAFGRPVTRLPNGKEVIELPTYRETLPNGATYLTFDTDDRSDADDIAEITVPADHVFLMGDNRDHSADSRFPFETDAQGNPGGGLGGPVPLSDIGGRAEFITFSFNGKESLNPLTWWGALRSGRAWSSLRPAIVPHENPGNRP